MAPRIKIYEPNIQVMLHKTNIRSVLNGNNPVSQQFQGTSSTIARGTGFIKRVRRSGGSDSPYLAEMMETPTNR